MPLRTTLALCFIALLPAAFSVLTVYECICLPSGAKIHSNVLIVSLATAHESIDDEFSPQAQSLKSLIKYLTLILTIIKKKIISNFSVLIKKFLFSCLNNKI